MSFGFIPHSPFTVLWRHAVQQSFDRAFDEKAIFIAINYEETEDTPVAISLPSLALQEELVKFVNETLRGEHMVELKDVKIHVAHFFEL
jgi:hypothetical protein